MSATNRGAERQPADFYETPHWATRRLLDVLPVTDGMTVLEPCAGRGAIVEAIGRGTWLTNDLHFEAPLLPNIRAHSQDDATDPHALRTTFREWGIDAVISNPPFSLAEPIALALVYTFRCPIALLLRLNWLGGGRRLDRVTRNAQLIDRLPVPSVYVLPQRPSFVTSVKCRECVYQDSLTWRDKVPRQCPRCRGRVRSSSSDATEYAWMIWNLHSPPRIGIFEDTPLEQRKPKGNP